MGPEPSSIRIRVKGSISKSWQDGTSRGASLRDLPFFEGGANTVSEALAAGVPVIASDIPENVGMLGEDYPGYYPVGDEQALARSLEQVENDTAFRELLKAWCAARRHLTTPEREQGALDALVKEAARYPRAV